MENLHSLSTGPTPILPREVFSEVILVLREALPGKLTQDRATAVLRERAAMASVAALLPETGVEGQLAAQFVVANAWAMDCLTLARERQLEPRVADRCRAQAMGMMREGKAALRELRVLQAQRRALAADAAAAERAAWVEYGVASMMAEALEGRAVGADDLAAAPVGVREFGRVSLGEESCVETRFETDSITMGSDLRQAPSPSRFRPG